SPSGQGRCNLSNRLSAIGLQILKKISKMVIPLSLDRLHWSPSGQERCNPHQAINSELSSRFCCTGLHRGKSVATERPRSYKFVLRIALHANNNIVIVATERPRSYKFVPSRLHWSPSGQER